VCGIAPATAAVLRVIVGRMLCIYQSTGRNVPGDMNLKLIVWKAEFDTLSSRPNTTDRRIMVRFSVRTKYLTNLKSLNRLWGPHIIIFNVHPWFLTGGGLCGWSVKLRIYLQRNAEVKNKWNYTATRPSVCLHGVHRVNLTFIFASDKTAQLTSNSNKIKLFVRIKMTSSIHNWTHRTQHNFKT
jgi:hypothetical protein